MTLMIVILDIVVYKILNSCVIYLNNQVFFKMSKHGGKREGAGRKPKQQEQDLIDKLDTIINKEEVIKKLGEKALSGDMRAMGLYMGYRYGKPKETKDIHINEDVPLFID